MILKEMFDDKLKDCFMGGIPMKEFTFDLQRFEGESYTLNYSNNKVTVSYSDTSTITSLFTISGVDSDAGLTIVGTPSSDSVVVSVASDAAAFNDTTIKIEKIKQGNYTLAYGTAGAGKFDSDSYTWSVSNGKATYDHNGYYTLNTYSDTLTYTKTENEVTLKLGNSNIIDTTTGIGDAFQVNRGSDTITVKALPGADTDGTSDGFLSSSATITGGRVAYTFDNLTSDISTFTAENEHLSIDSDAGKVTILGNWNAGYNLTNNKTLAFHAGQTDASLATITKLAKGSDTNLYNLSFATDTDIVTFKNAALSKDPVKITNAKDPTGTLNKYKLALDSDAKLVTSGGSIATSTNIWEVNSSNQATFKNVTRTNYKLNNDDTEISQVAQTTNEIYGVIKYPTTTGAPAGSSDVALIDADNQGDLLLSYVKDAPAATTEVGIAAAAINATNVTKGFTFTVYGKVLPQTGGTVKLSNQLGDSKFALDPVTAGPQVASSDTQKFSFAEGKLTAYLSNGYALANSGTTIKNATAGSDQTLVTITGLNSTISDTDVTKIIADKYFSIEGYNSDTAPVGDANGGIGSSDTITITLNKKALNKKPAYISKNPTDSFKYELALDSDAKLTTNDGTIVTDTNIWVFSGAKATYKHVTPEHYTLDTDTGKISYQKQADIANYAIISGLNSEVIGATDTTYTLDGSIVYTEKTTVKGFDVSDTLLMQVSGSDIKLGATVLTNKNVALTMGSSGQTYQLSLFTESDEVDGRTVTSDVAVASPDITQKWWTFATDTGMATLHQRTQEGYRESGNLVQYFAATSDSDNGKTLATITGLSSDVKVFDSDGGVIAADAGVTDTQLGVSLGINSETIAHTTWNFEDGGFIENTEQTITLTDAMLSKKKITLADKDSKDSDTFKLAFTDDVDDIPATEAALANSWAVGGDSDTTTLTYQEYKKGYYTKNSDNNIINYTKDTQKSKLFSLTVTKSGRAVDVYQDDDGVLKIATATSTDTFVTVSDTDSKVVTLESHGVSTDTGNAISFKATDKNYQDFKLETGFGVQTVDWSTSDTWAINGTNATFSIRPQTNGYELSADGSTLNYRNSDVALFTLQGLKDGVTDTDLAKATYDKDEKTLTLTQDVLGKVSKKITLTPTNKTETYSLQLDDEVPQTPGVQGYSWAAVTTPGTISVNAVTRDYYTLKNNTTIEYTKEVKNAPLFTISGLKTSSINRDFTDTDGDNVLNAAHTDTGIVAGEELLTFDSDAKVVTIATEKILDTSSDGVKITLSKGWSFNTDSFTAPSYKSSGKWSIDGDDVVLTIKGSDVNPGYKISPNGQTLTYVAATDQTLLTISGLNVPTGAETETFLTSLKDAFDQESTVTLPQSVLGTAPKIKLTPEDKNDKFTLLLNEEIRQTGVDGYSWAKSGDSDGSYSLTFKNVTREYWTSDSSTAFTYHKEAEKKKLFTLSGDGLTSDVGVALNDKDGNTILNDTNDKEYISVNTDNGKVTLNPNIVHNANGDNGKAVTIKNGNSGKTYTFSSETDLVSSLQYGKYSWATDATKATLNAEATTDGFILSNADTKLTYVASKGASGTDVLHPVLELTGFNTETALSATGNAAFDPDEKTVTLKNDVLNKTKVSIKSLNGNTYTLKLDPDTVNLSAISGYTWDVVAGTGEASDTRIVTAKAVTQDYYASDTSGTAFTYNKEKLNQTLFTIDGLTNIGTDTGISDKNADNALTSGNTTYMSFDTESKKVTINSTILPMTDTKTVTISGKYSYTISGDDITQPTFNSDKVKWTKYTTSDSAVLSVTPESAGWEFSKSNTVLTRVSAERELAKLSGLATTASSDTLKNGITVSIDDKTISMFKAALDKTTKVSLNKASDYKFIIEDSEVQVGQKTENGTRVVEDVWQLGATDASTGLTAYYREVYPEYYSINANSDTITYTKPEKKTDYVTINGLATDVNVTAEGTIGRGGNSLVEVYNDSSNTNTKVIGIASAALGTDATIAKGKNYRFELTDPQAKLKSQDWSYTTDGTITITGRYETGALVSADGKSINLLAANETDQTLATITGLKKNLPFAGEGASDISKHFTFDGDAKTITFNDDTFFTNTKVSVSGAFFDYTLALGDELNTNTKKTSSEWSVTTDTTYAATATYKALTEAAYTLDTKTSKSISTQMEKAGKTAAQITGLKFASSDVTIASGSDINAFSIKSNSLGNVDDVVVIDTSEKTISLKGNVLPTGSSAATIKASGYKLVLDDDTLKTEVEYSAFNANQAATDTSMVIKATSGAYYDIANAAKGTIVFKPENTDVTIATLTGLKTSEAAITNAAITNNQTKIGHGIFVDTDEKTITVDDDAMNGSDVSISTTHSYKLALNDEQNKDAYDIWSINTGTAVFKEQTPHYYSVDTKTNKIKSVKEAITKTYFTITGLNPATDSTKLLVSHNADGYFIAASDAATTSVVNFDGNDTITLGLKALPNTGVTDNTTIKVTKGKNGTASYKLALAENMPVATFVAGSDPVISNVTSWGVAAEGTKTFSLSGNKVVYSAPIKAGYTLSAKGDSIIVADGTKDKEYFSISGLKVTSETSLSDTILVSSDNVVTIKQAVLGTSKVSISNSNYTLELADDVDQNHDLEEYADFKNGTLYVKQGESDYYSINSRGEIIYTGEKNAKTLATVTGLKSTLSDTQITALETTAVDFNNKVINITSDVITTTSIHIATGKNDYSLTFNDITTGSQNSWSVTNGTAILNATSSSDTWKLAADGDSIDYTKAGNSTQILKLSGLANNVVATEVAVGSPLFATTNSINGVTVASDAAEDGVTPLKVTIDSRVLNNKDVSVTTTNGSYNPYLELASSGDNSIKTAGETVQAWNYDKKGDTVTFAYQNQVPVYYTFKDEDSTTAKYHSATSVDLVKLSGTGFNSAITELSDTAAINALKNYVNIVESDDSVPVLKIGTDAGLTYLTTTDTSKSVTITTPKVNGVAYDVEIASGEIAMTGEKKWSLSGNSLVLSKALSDGYKLNGSKLSYAASDTTGSKIFTINGLDLTDAKAAMMNYTPEQTNTINQRTSDVATAQAAYDSATGTAKTTAKKALNDAKDELTKTIAGYQSTNLNAYLNNSETSPIAIEEDDKQIKINGNLLGTSNVSVTKNGTDSYQLVIGDGVDTEEPLQSLAWSFSGSTATLKQTKEKYYTYNEDKNQITYNKPVIGETVATIKGLATSKVLNTSSDTYKVVASDVSISTSTHTSTLTQTETYTVHSNTRVVKLSDEGVIGTVDITNTQLFTTTTVTVTYLESDNKTVKSTKDPKVTETSKKSAITAGTPSTFTKGLEKPVGSEDVIVISNNVLGTSNVTLTNGKDQSYKLSIATSGNNSVSGPSTSNKQWTGTLGGTSAVYKGNITAGYTLENDEKITYTASKDDAALLTVSGIKIPTSIVSDTATITSANDSDTRNAAIKWWLGENVSVGDETDGAAEVTVQAAALNEKDVTAKSGSATNYTLVLGEGVSTGPADTFGWKGWIYQSYSSGYYNEVETNGSINYNPAGKATPVAQVKGAKGSLDVATQWNNGILTLNAANLGTGTVSVSGSGVTLALGNNVPTYAGERPVEGEWATNGTTATKRDGTPAHYTLGNNVITYTKESGAKKTFATITGLKAGADVSNAESNGVVTLNGNMVDKKTVTITNGKDAGEINYTLAIGTEIDTPKTSDSKWTSKGYISTISAAVKEGYELSADSKKLQYTPASTGKALATFQFDQAAVTSETTPALSDKVLTLSKGKNTKITVKTNPGALTFKLGSDFANGSIVGSAAADTFDANNIANVTISAVGGDDVIKNLGATSSVSGGAGNDSIAVGSAANVTVHGDAGNDSITGTPTNGSFYGGAGNDYFELTASGNLTIYGEAGNDTIKSGSVNVIGGVGNDSIEVETAGAVAITGDAGNDYIELKTSANGTSVWGGVGNDTIKVEGATGVSVMGDAGNDNITLEGTGTVFAGAGNDTVDMGDGTVTFYYANGNGNDLVKNFTIGTDRLELNTTIKSASVGGADSNNLILQIGSGKVTLEGAYSSGDTFTYYNGNTQSSVTIAGTGSSDLLYDTNGLLADDNLMTPNDISDLVSTNSVTEYAIGNYDTNIMAPDQILSEGDLISYGDQQKKNNK